MGIRSFGNRATKRFAHGDWRRLHAELTEKIDFLFKLLDRGTFPEDLHAEGIRVHRLAGDRRGFSAIEVSANWRIRFEDPRSIPAAAEQLGVECGELERVLDGKAPITPELALRMESVWNSRAGLWLDLQTDYDLA